MYLSTIALAAGSWGTSCVTILLSALAPVIFFDLESIVRSMSVTTRPNEAALVTSLPDIRQMYGWCVWAETMAPMRLSSPAAMASMSGPLKFTHLSTSTYSLPVGVTFGSVGGAGGVCVPPWCRSTTNDLIFCSRLSFWTSALAVTTSSRNSSPATPDGVTTVGVPRRSCR